MQLDRLEISGFLHFDKPAVLDLRDVPPGLVAVVGPNGEGKTRLLDGGPASIYGAGAANWAFPSREGTLAAYATSREAYIDALWTLDGVGTYHARTSVDGLRRTSEAVLEQLLPGGLRATLNDGKVTTFRDAVTRVFPSRRQVLASAYAAQGRQGSFVGLGQRERLELFSEMLALSHYAEMAETARLCATVAERVRTGLASAVELLARDTSDAALQAATVRIHELTERVLRGLNEKALLANRIDEAESARAAVADVAARHMAAVERRAAARAAQETAQAAVARLDAAQRAAVAQSEADMRALAARLSATLEKAQKDERAANLRLDATHQALVQRIQSLQAVVADADEIRAAVARKQQLDDDVAGARRRIDALSEQRAAAQERLSAARQELSTAREARQGLQTRQASIRTLAVVPFGEKCAEAKCQFVSLAVQSRGEIPALEAIVATIPSLESRIAIADSEVREVTLAMSDCARAVSDGERQARALSARAAQETVLAVAESQVEDLQEQVSDLGPAHRERLASLAQAREAALREDAESREAERRRLDARLAAIAQERAEANADVDRHAQATMAAHDEAAQTKDAAVQLATLDAQLRGLRDALRELDTEQARDEALKQMAEQQAQAVRAKQSEHRDAMARLASVDDEWLAWRMLVQALGRDGLPKLEIDAAGPGVADLTNQLLAVGYGTRFTVDLTTQVARADGKGLKEEFTITVFDNQFGHQLGDLSDLSGGERVMVEEALRAGILLFNNARQQRPIRTCWRDETTGALYPETVPLYVAMLRRMHEIGGFRHTLFITHSEAAAELADTVVSVKDGVPTWGGMS